MGPDTGIVAKFGVYVHWTMHWAYNDGGVFTDCENGEFGGDLVTRFHLF